MPPRQPESRITETKPFQEGITLPPTEQLTQIQEQRTETFRQITSILDTLENNPLSNQTLNQITSLIEQETKLGEQLLERLNEIHKSENPQKHILDFFKATLNPSDKQTETLFLSELSKAFPPHIKTEESSPKTEQALVPFGLHQSLETLFLAKKQRDRVAELTHLMDLVEKTPPTTPPTESSDNIDKPSSPQEKTKQTTIPLKPSAIYTPSRPQLTRKNLSKDKYKNLPRTTIFLLLLAGIAAGIAKNITKDETKKTEDPTKYADINSIKTPIPADILTRQNASPPCKSNQTQKTSPQSLHLVQIAQLDPDIDYTIPFNGLFTTADRTQTLSQAPHTNNADPHPPKLENMGLLRNVFDQLNQVSPPTNHNLSNHSSKPPTPIPTPLGPLDKAPSTPPLKIFKSSPRNHPTVTQSPTTQNPAHK